jgi:hypothetical protein
VEIDSTGKGLTPTAPPKRRASSQFRPGRSGNAKGRPKGSESRKKIMTRVMAEMHVVTEHGKRRRRSTLDLILISLRNRAAEGDGRAFQALHDWLERFEPRPSSQEVGYLLIPELPFPQHELRKRLEEQQRAMMEDVNWLERLAATTSSNAS